MQGKHNPPARAHYEVAWPAINFGCSGDAGGGAWLYNHHRHQIHPHTHLIISSGNSSKVLAADRMECPAAPVRASVCMFCSDFRTSIVTCFWNVSSLWWGYSFNLPRGRMSLDADE
jgi:hypothetical protein